jgi:hypothetical protein
MDQVFRRYVIDMEVNGVTKYARISKDAMFARDLKKKVHDSQTNNRNSMLSQSISNPDH